MKEIFPFNAAYVHFYRACASPAYLQCPGRRRPRAPTATVCIYSMYSVTEGEDVNRIAKFCVPWAVNFCHQLCETAVCPWERSRDGWRHFSSVVGQ